MRRTQGWGWGWANLGFFSVIAVIVSGCVTMRPYDPGPGKRVAAIVARDTYLSGESVNVTISNLSEVTLFYPNGFCKIQLQRRDGTQWMTIPNRSAGCPVSLDFLDPRQTVVHQYRLPKEVGVGTYRLTIPMPLPDVATRPEPELLTQSFKVASQSAR